MSHQDRRTLAATVLVDVSALVLLATTTDESEVYEESEEYEECEEYAARQGFPVIPHSSDSSYSSET
jgi:hypothetical protein